MFTNKATTELLNKTNWYWFVWKIKRTFQNFKNSTENILADARLTGDDISNAGYSAQKMELYNMVYCFSTKKTKIWFNGISERAQRVFVGESTTATSLTKCSNSNGSFYFKWFKTEEMQNMALQILMVHLNPKLTFENIVSTLGRMIKNLEQFLFLCLLHYCLFFYKDFGFSVLSNGFWAVLLFLFLNRFTFFICRINFEYLINFISLLFKIKY